MPEAIKTEAQMSEAVAERFKNSAREIRVGNCVLDVVAYNNKQRLFSVIECKLGSDPTTLGQTFGQITIYNAAIIASTRDFLDGYTQRVWLRYEQIMDATYDNRQIRVAFYVALTDEACTRIDWLRSLKERLPGVGIVRVKLDGRCRSYLKVNGQKDAKITVAAVTTVPILSSKTAST